MFKINLVPEVQEKKQQIKRVNTYSTIFAIALLSICGAALLIVGGIELAKKAELSNTNKKIADIKAESEQYLELEKTVISLENGLAGIKQITDGTNNWTKLFPHIEAATPQDVQYKSFRVEAGTIKGNVVGKSVDSLARLIESYKNYQIITLSGSGNEGESLSISVDNKVLGQERVKSTGRWIYAINFDPNVNHEIKVEAKDKEPTSILYEASTKKLKSNDSVTAEVKTLFSNIEIKDYSNREEKGTSFDVTYNFDASVLW